LRVCKDCFDRKESKDNNNSSTIITGDILSTSSTSSSHDNEHSNMVTVNKTTTSDPKDENENEEEEIDDNPDINFEVRSERLIKPSTSEVTLCNSNESKVKSNSSSSSSSSFLSAGRLSKFLRRNSKQTEPPPASTLSLADNQNESTNKGSF
jgi:hypothetical protein